MPAAQPATAPWSRLHTTASAGLERWFAAQGAPARHDLARSGAESLSISDLLAHAGDSARDDLLALSLDYGDPQGSLRLRQAIVDSGAARSIDEVVVTTGAAEALLLAGAALVEPGDRVRVATPAYEALDRAMAAVGARVDPVSVWQAPATGLDPSGLLAGGACRVVVVNSPHNPTGLRWSASVVEGLAADVESRGGQLIVDEVARGTLDRRACSVAALDAFSHGAVVAVGDVSKAFGVGGLRIGWLTCADPAVVHRAAALKDLTSLGPPAPSQLLAALALEQRAALLQRVAADAAASRTALETWIAETDGAWWARPVDGLVAFPHLGPGVDDHEVAGRLRTEHDVGVVPGSLFGQPGHIRLGLGAARDAVAAALAALTAVLEWTAPAGRRRAA